MKREPAFRKHVAKFAGRVLDGSIDFFAFLEEIGGDDYAYETGDEDVDKLIDLLEHEPEQGRFGVNGVDHAKYLAEVDVLSKRLSDT